jgi:uncharacterized membrane protein YidH (DUF202 family)
LFAGGAVTINLRVSLSILSAGFGIEGGSELASFASRGSFQPGPNLLFVLPALMTLLGLLFVWIGRHEWNMVHHDRVRSAHIVFGLSLLGGVVAGAVVGALVAFPQLGTPAWASLAFGAAIGSLVLGTFVTYVLLVFHLVARPSQLALFASLAWALFISVLVANAFAAHCGEIVSLAVHRTLTVPTFFSSVDTLTSYLFVSYFLLLAAYLVAHGTVARGPGPGDPMAGGVPRGTPDAGRPAP